MSATEKPSFLEELPSTGNESQILLCAHGLNQNPNALKLLLNDINKMGFKVFLFHMPGHAGESDFSNLTSQSYSNAHRECYQYLKTTYGKEVNFLGYSFGGLIGVNQFEECPFEKMVLLAPALKVHGYTKLIRFALPFISRIVSVKIGDAEFEKKYRYHQEGVPSTVYSSFFEIYSRYSSKGKSHLSNAKAMVAIHPRDELVSHRKLKKWVLKETSWRFTSLSNKEAEFRRYNHLCFDPTTLGKESYEGLLSEIKSFLN